VLFSLIELNSMQTNFFQEKNILRLHIRTRSPCSANNKETDAITMTDALASVIVIASVSLLLLL